MSGSAAHTLYHQIVGGITVWCKIEKSRSCQDVHNVCLKHKSSNMELFTFAQTMQRFVIGASVFTFCLRESDPVDAEGKPSCPLSFQPHM